MMDKVTTNELVVGQRYWLDRIKDVSAIYAGVDESSICFNQVEGDSGYYTTRNSQYGYVIGFPKDSTADFYPLEK